MLSSAAIMKLVTTPPTGIAAGAVQFAARQAVGAYGANAPTAAQAQFLRDLVAQYPSGAAAQRTTYAYPQPRGVASRGGGPLTPVELAWIGTLPADPAEVPFDDAQALASIVADVSPVAHPTDARLLQAKWAPVQEVHDRRSAAVDLTNAQSTAVAPVPSSTLRALADAVAAEQPALRDEEALTRASAMLTEATAGAHAVRDTTIARATAALAKPDQARADRLSVTR